MHQKIIKTGHSLAVTIPSVFAKTFGLKPGTTVRVRSDISRGVLTLTFPGSGQLTLLPKSSSPR